MGLVHTNANRATWHHSVILQVVNVLGAQFWRPWHMAACPLRVRCVSAKGTPRSLGDLTGAYSFSLFSLNIISVTLTA